MGQFYQDPKDFRDIHEFMDQFGDKINQGLVEEGYMMEAVCDFILEMASSDLRATTSQLKRLYMHLLKYQYQPNKQTRSWINSIRNSRYEVNEGLMASKSVANKVDIDCQQSLYYHARKEAAGETYLPIKTFPEQLPDEYRLDLILDSEYLNNFLRQYACSNDAKKELDL